jgi:hypothetical protein
VGAIQGVDSSLATNALLLNPFGGNVGIGTTGPVARLNVVGANAASIALISGASTAVRIGSSGTYSQIEGVDPTGVGSYQPLQVGGSTLDFTIAGAKKVSIDTNGNVGIGTTGPGAKLDVSGTFNVTGDVTLAKTITATGTTGNQTINKTTGRVNFAAAAQSLTVTCNLVTANSIIICTVATDDATANSCKAIPGSGSFTLKLNAAATAETAVCFHVTN